MRRFLSFGSVILAFVMAFVMLCGCEQKEKNLVSFSPYIYIDGCYDTFDAVLLKYEGTDFIVLNLSDPQILARWWDINSVERQSMEYTVEELIKRVEPDLITISGDIAACGEITSFIEFGNFIDRFGIPWAPVWGNHDHDYEEYGWAMPLAEMEALYTAGYENCLFRSGPAELGSGNYVIGIQEGDRIVEAFFMMDSHDRVEVSDENGNVWLDWAPLNTQQIEWYKQKVSDVRMFGCEDSTLITHIPIYAYREAFAYAVTDIEEAYNVSVADSYNGVGWIDSMKDVCFGVNHQRNVGSYSFDDGVFAAIKEMDHTKHTIAGHDHFNCFSILYEGVRLSYGLKTGSGAQCEAEMNGGTVLRITSNGVEEIYHEFVDISHITTEPHILFDR